MLRRVCTLILPGVLFLLLSGCLSWLGEPVNYSVTSANERVGQTWLGVHIGELIEAWGLPASSRLKEQPAEPGRRYYYWEKSHSETFGGDCNYDDNGNVTTCDPVETITYACTERFEAGPDGVLDNFSAYGDCGYFSTRPARTGGGRI